MTEQNKQSSQPFAWYWHDQHGCLYITGDDRKPDLPADAQPLYATEQNRQSDTPAPETQMTGVPLTEWEINRLSMEASAKAAVYSGHAAMGMRFRDNEKADMDRWHALAEKLSKATATPSPETRAAVPMSETTPVSETDGAAISERVER